MSTVDDSRQAAPTLPRPRGAAAPLPAPRPEPQPTAVAREPQSSTAGSPVRDSAGSALLTPRNATHERAPRAVSIAEQEHARRLIRSSETVTIGCFLLIAVCGTALAGFGTDTMHAGWLVGCAFTAALLGIALARIGGLERARRRDWHRPLLAVLLVATLVADGGVVAATGGITGPFWVVFIPLVLFASAVLGAEAAVAVGALASAALYAATAWSGTLGGDVPGRLVVVLPLFPAIAYAASAVGAVVRRTAQQAADDSATLDRDLRRLEAVLSRVADGDLSVMPSVDSDAHPASVVVAVALSDTVVSLRRVARGIVSGVERIEGDAHRLLASAQALASSAAQQDSAVSEVTATVDQLAATSAAIAETARSVAEYAERTLAYAAEGDSAVEASAVAMTLIEHRVDAIVERLDGLVERGERIDVILGGIDALAKQTHMLALNAAIEAARAGEHGHGFRVVAGEISKLAERARAETRRIAAIVAEIHEDTTQTREATLVGAADVREGAERARGVVAALQRIAAMVTATTSAAADISSATSAQLEASQRVVGSMDQVAVASERYAAAARESSAAAADLTTLSEALAAQVSALRLPAPLKTEPVGPTS